MSAGTESAGRRRPSSTGRTIIRRVVPRATRARSRHVARAEPEPEPEHVVVGQPSDVNVGVVAGPERSSENIRRARTAAGGKWRARGTRRRRRDAGSGGARGPGSRRSFAGRRLRSRVGVGVGSSEAGAGTPGGPSGTRLRRRRVPRQARARGLAPKASSDLESSVIPPAPRGDQERRRRDRRDGEAAKVLGDLARLGGYTSWDQVPTGGGGGGGRTGDFDDAHRLTSPASEATSGAARGFRSTACPHGARLRARGG